MSLMKHITKLLLIQILSISGLLAQELVIENINSFSGFDVACEKPLWSPDGNYILLRGIDNYLYTVNSEDGSIEKIPNTNGLKADVGWQNSNTVWYKTKSKVNQVKITEYKSSTR